MKNGTSLFSLRNTKILTNMQKKIFEILVQTALTVGLFWTILKLTPKSALLSFTILYLIGIKHWYCCRTLSSATCIVHHILSYVRFISYSKCSNWHRILKLSLNFGCLFTFCYLDGANSIKIDLHICNLWTG